VATARSGSRWITPATRRAARSRRGAGGIGIVGGTFDPVHLAHLRVAEEVREAQRLDEVRLVPSAVPPHKRRGDVAPAADRLRMVEAAVAGHAGLRVWGIELERPGPSYTIDTLRTLRAELGEEVRVVFALGWDAFAEINTWKEYAAIFGVCDVVVVTRPGQPTALAAGDFPVAARKSLRYDRGSAGFRHVSGHRVTLQHVTALDISATDIRARVRAGRSIRFLVPDPVRIYIHAHGLYGTSRRIRPVE
jgi:nicotinate-nucleotide adenylyltransferase